MPKEGIPRTVSQNKDEFSDNSDDWVYNIDEYCERLENMDQSVPDER